MKSTTKTKEIDIIADLTSEKNRAIEELDFDKAEQVYKEIQKEYSRRSEDSFALISMEVSDSVLSAEENYKMKFQRITDSQENEENKLKSNYYNITAEMQRELDQKIRYFREIKDKKLSNLEPDFTKYYALIEQAKRAASKADFAKARELKNEAENMKKDALASSAENVEKEFNENCKNAEDEYKARKDELKRKHYEELYTRQNTYKLEIEKLRNDTLSHIKLCYQKSEAMVHTLTTSEEDKNQMIDKLKVKFREDTNRINEFKFVAKKKIIEPESKKDEFFVTAPRPRTARTPRRQFGNTTRNVERKETKTPKKSTRISFTARQSPRIVTPKSVFF